MINRCENLNICSLGLGFGDKLELWFGSGNPLDLWLWLSFRDGLELGLWVIMVKE